MSKQFRIEELPLTVGVISDTHIYPNGSRSLPSQIHTLFRRANVDLVLHLGDINYGGVLIELETIAPVLAVQGNNDDADLARLLPVTRRLTIGSHEVGMVHGHGGRSARDVARATYAGKVDLALYGHSHIPRIDHVDGTMLLNPGSATDRRWHPHFGIAVIRFDEKGFDPQVILYADPQHLDTISFEWSSDDYGSLDT